MMKQINAFLIFLIGLYAMTSIKAENQPVKNSNRKDQFAVARYAPPGMYMKDHYPLNFPPIIPCPFKSGIYTFPNPPNEGQGTFYQADDDGASFAHEIIEFKGQWHMTGAVGVDGHTKLNLTHIEWTADGLIQGFSQDKVLPLPGEVFPVDGHEAFIILPEKPANPVPWVWYAPTLPGLPGPEERWMFERFLEAGIAIAGIDAGESYGSPDGRKLYTALYKELTERRGFSARPMMLGRSRGGLMTLNWIAENPDKTSGFAGIYPVCNLASYPGLDKACAAYHLTEEQLAEHLNEHNPVNRMELLAQANIPLFAIHGDQDALVPLEKNSGELKKQYDALGGRMELIVPEGQGHNMWEGFFQCRELVDFVIKNAK